MSRARAVADEDVDAAEVPEPSSIEPPIVEEPEEAETSSGWWWRWWHSERVRLADLTDDVVDDIGHSHFRQNRSGWADARGPRKMPPGRPAGKDKLREMSETAPYLFAKDRLATFKNFSLDKIEDARCTSDELARAGFYCTGIESAKCPFCLKELDFEPEDDAWSEHKQRGVNCEFVKIGKPDDTKLTVEDVIRLATRSVAMAKYEQHVALLEEWRKNLNHDTMAEQLTKLMTATPKPKTGTRTK
ncbi:unnamed protein product [Caenorhabditis sp. 36 PRJEB53466]|nr:unnamed protein product [Caenorhabditis sp. 36 PRJEB53466]